jgi:hypothetical protein
MKELRIPGFHARIICAFDPKRSAIFPIAGDEPTSGKSGTKRTYRSRIGSTTNIAELREAQQLNQTDLGKQSGVGQRTATSGT